MHLENLVCFTAYNPNIPEHLVSPSWGIVVATASYGVTLPQFPKWVEFWLPTGTYTLEEGKFASEINNDPLYLPDVVWWTRPAQTINMTPGAIFVFGDEVEGAPDEVTPPPNGYVRRPNACALKWSPIARDWAASNATPTGSPTATPTGSPTATPKGTPTATPKGTPTATPKGTPTATPKGTPAATPTAPCSWTGAWNTNFNEMRLTQAGNSVTGDYDYDGGTITGTVSGDTLTGTWSEVPPPSDAGGFVFTMSPDCQSWSGTWGNGSDSGPASWQGTRASGAPTEGTPTPPPAATPSATEQEIFRVSSIGVAYNGATKPTTFTISASWLVTEITTYHWNNGQGKTPGTIGLRAADGATYGPWQATGLPGSGGVPDAQWVVKPNIVIPPGTYTVLDSDPSTWAQNSETGGAGMSWGNGIRQN